MDDKGDVLSPEELVGVLLLGTPSGTRVAVSESMGSLVEKVAEERGIRVIRVGRYRFELTRAARRAGASLVCSSRGEVAFTDFSPSFDGMLSAVKLMEVISKFGEKLSTLRRALPHVPTLVREVDVAGRPSEVVNALYEKYDRSVLTMTGVRVWLEGVWVDVQVKPGKAVLTVEDVEGARNAIGLLREELESLTREARVTL